jgi:hypothetical protein
VWVDEGVGGGLCVGVCGRGCVGVCGGCVGGGYMLPNQSLANERHVRNIAMCTVRPRTCTWVHVCVKGRAGCASGWECVCVFVDVDVCVLVLAVVFVLDCTVLYCIVLYCTVQ